MDKHFTSMTIHALYRAMLISLIEAEIYFYQVRDTIAYVAYYHPDALP